MVHRRARSSFFSSVIIVPLIAVLITACAPATQTGPRDQCGFIEPSQDDVNKILSFGKDAFSSTDWIKSYTVEPYKVTVSRHNDVEQAVAYAEYLIYTCGYGQEEMNQYFNDEGFNIVFEGYESHVMSAFCEIESLALYRFDLVDEGIEYTANYWVEQTDDYHVTVMMIVFPRTSIAQIDEYSTKLFPQLTICE